MRAPPAPRLVSVNSLTNWWRDTTRRSVLTAMIMMVVTVGGAYGEAHPNQPSDQVVHGHHVPQTPTAAILLVALAAAILAGRRRFPLTVLAISASSVTVYSLLGYVNGAALLAPMVALYAVAVTVSVRRAMIAASLTLAALMVSTGIANPFGTTGGGFFLIPAMVAAALFGGIAVSNRRAFRASIQARADDEARRRVDEERLRIARELHDVVAHTMSTINVQASAALVVPDRPEAAQQALRAIKAASKNGLRELRSILNVLRQADDTQPTTPAPGLAQVDALVSGARQAGLPTVLTIRGDAAALPAGIDLAAYRIVQESLTNAIRHADQATATVTLTYLETELLIEVADTGHGGTGHGGTGHGGTGHGGTGHGIIGMRERAAAAGGTLRAEPVQAGGYLVTARLPVTRMDDAGTRGEPADPPEPPTLSGPTAPHEPTTLPEPSESAAPRLAPAEEGARP